MTRVKRGVISMKRRRNILKQVKGFRHGRKSKERMAREALLHAVLHAFHDRRKKKRNGQNKKKKKKKKKKKRKNIPSPPPFPPLSPQKKKEKKKYESFVASED